MWFPRDLNMGRAKYLAIADALEQDIRAGKVLPGDHLPPQRELATQLSVNLTTISRAYRDAERRGLTKGVVGKGTYVSADAVRLLEQTESSIFKSDIIEMGMVLSLRHLEPNLEEQIAKSSQKQDVTQFGGYSEPAGLPKHLGIGAEWVKQFGLHASADQLTITTGAQHALTCILMTCFKPGDHLAVDCLTYPGLKALAAMMNIRLTPIPIDAAGMTPDSLKTACQSYSVNGVYLMPGFHNPTGITMPAKRRQELLSIIKEQHLLLIEDDPYFFLANDTQPAMSSFLPDNSIFICSFSKMLYAGLRVAFTVSSKKIRSRLAGAILNTVWMTPPLNAAIICDAIEDGTVARVIRQKIKETKRRNEIAWSILPGKADTSQNRGFFIWYNLPEPWSGYEFERQAKLKRVSVSCAEQFAVGSPKISPAVRICLTAAPSLQELSTGLARLSETLSNYWQLNNKT